MLKGWLAPKYLRLLFSSLFLLIYCKYLPERRECVGEAGGFQPTVELEKKKKKQMLVPAAEAWHAVGISCFWPRGSPGGCCLGPR